MFHCEKRESGGWADCTDTLGQIALRCNLNDLTAGKLHYEEYGYLYWDFKGEPS